MKNLRAISPLLICLAVIFVFTQVIYAQDANKLLAESGDIYSVGEREVPAYMQKTVSLDLQEESLPKILSILEKRTGVKFTYIDNVIDKTETYSGSFIRVSLNMVLSTLLKGKDLEFLSLKGGYIILKEKQYSDNRYMLQTPVVGTVTDAETGETLLGANVSVEGTARGASVDAEGNYKIPGLEPGTYTITASFIGYQPNSREVTITEGQEPATINFELSQDDLALDEVVVIGYGEQEESNISGAISSVGSDDISGASAGDIQGALSGRISGVNITPSTGQPGAPLDMNIRGVSTFGNSNPLFVIDGVPVFNESGGTTNPMATLNPNNIESVEILKDASASAIYGARAANGVVIITTKGGQAGDTQFSFSVKRGVSSVTETIDMMNSAQFIDYSIKAHQNGGGDVPDAFQEPLLSENLNRNTDWQEAAHNSAVTEEYSFSVSGGSEDATYAFTSSYYDQEGTMPNSGFKRYSARINSNFNIGDNFRVGESIELSRGVWNGTFGPSTDIMQELLQSSPTQPIYNSDNLGGFAGPRNEYGPVNRSNQIGALSLADDQTRNNRLLGSVFAEYDFLDNLTYRLNLGGDITFNDSKNFTPRYEMGNRSNPVASLNENRFNENTYLIENTLTYDAVFNDVHEFTALVGYTQQESWSRNLSGGIQEFPSNSVRTIAAGFGQSNVTGDESGWALRSQMSRLNYSYDDRYNLMVTVRRDGSSRFGENNRYGIFPSFSGNWLVSNESFMEDVSAISNLKVRGSWGQVGSQSISDFASYATIEPVARYILGESQSLVPGATYMVQGNANLKWETTTQTNVGLDIGLLDERLSLVMDYYIKKTDDILLRVPVPSNSGIRRNNGAFRNAGSMHNEGFEFAADYQNSIGGLDYTVSGNISTSKNEVTALGSGEPIIAEMSSDPNYATTITKVGGELGAFYGYIMDGVFRDDADLNNHANQPGASAGDVKYRDLNDDGVINADDQTVIGSPFPDYNYGFNIKLLYNNFDMGIFLQGKQGHDIFNLIWAGINDGEGDNNATTNMLDRWTPNNRETNVPRAVLGDPNQNYRPSTRFVEDGSYLRIQNVQLGYSLSSSLASKINLSNLRIFVSAKNLFTFTGYRSYNPEVGTLTSGSRSALTRGIDFGAYPIPRTIEAGLQVDFN